MHLVNGTVNHEVALQFLKKFRHMFSNLHGKISAFVIMFFCCLGHALYASQLTASLDLRS